MSRVDISIIEENVIEKQKGRINYWSYTRLDKLYRI